MKKIKFGEVKWTIKIGIIGGWIVMVYCIIAFLIGFISYFIGG